MKIGDKIKHLLEHDEGVQKRRRQIKAMYVLAKHNKHLKLTLEGVYPTVYLRNTKEGNIQGSVTLSHLKEYVFPDENQ